jgi:hypothetical protein
MSACSPGRENRTEASIAFRNAENRTHVVTAAADPLASPPNRSSPPMAIPQGDGTVQCLSGGSPANIQKARGRRGQVKR